MSNKKEKLIARLDRIESEADAIRKELEQQEQDSRNYKIGDRICIFFADRTGLNVYIIAQLPRLGSEVHSCIALINVNSGYAWSTRTIPFRALEGYIRHDDIEYLVNGNDNKQISLPRREWEVEK